MQGYLLVFIGGGIGAAIRHGVSVAMARIFGGQFPFHTLFENVSGSLLMGVLAAYFSFRTGSSQSLRLFLATGILGGYTTFSTFSLDSIVLMQRSAYWSAAAYVVLSVGASFAGLLFGAELIRTVG